MEPDPSWLLRESVIMDPTVGYEPDELDDTVGLTVISPCPW